MNLDYIYMLINIFVKDEECNLDFESSLGDICALRTNLVIRIHRLSCTSPHLQPQIIHRKFLPGKKKLTETTNTLDRESPQKLDRQRINEEILSVFFSFLKKKKDRELKGGDPVNWSRKRQKLLLFGFL